MSNLTHLFHFGERVICRLDGISYKGMVTEVQEDHIIVNVPDVSDHCMFQEGFNMDCVYPDYYQGV